jgi:hypothetical protein
MTCANRACETNTARRTRARTPDANCLPPSDPEASAVAVDALVAVYDLLREVARRNQPDRAGVGADSPRIARAASSGDDR